MANTNRGGGFHDRGEKRRIFCAPAGDEDFAYRLGDEASIRIADALGRQLYRGCDDVFVTRPVGAAARDEPCEVIGIEELTSSRFRRRGCEVRCCEQLLYDRHVGAAGFGELSIDVIRKVRPQGARHTIDHRDPGPSVERADALDLAVRRHDCDVADAAQVLQAAPIRSGGEKHCIRDRDERRSLPTRRDIAHAKIADDVDSCALRDN